MIGKALSFPLRGEFGKVKIVIGGIALLLGFLIVPLFLVWGYLLRVVRVGAYDEPTPPRIDGWYDLLLDGVKLLLAVVAYLLPALVVAVGGYAVAGVVGGDVLFRGDAGLVFQYVMAFVVFYPLLAVIANVAVEERVGAATDVGTVLNVATTREYLFGAIVLWLIPSPTLVTGNAVVLAVVGTFVGFYGQMVAFYSVGRGFARAEGPLSTTLSESGSEFDRESPTLDPEG